MCSHPNPLHDPENVLPDDRPNPEDVRAEELIAEQREDSATDQFIEDSAFGLV